MPNEVDKLPAEISAFAKELQLLCNRYHITEFVGVYDYRENYTGICQHSKDKVPDPSFVAIRDQLQRMLLEVSQFYILKPKDNG